MIATLVTASDRERILVWLESNTSITWESGAALIPCLELRDFTRPSLICATVDGLKVVLSGSKEIQFEKLSAYDFCTQCKRMFPRKIENKNPVNSRRRKTKRQKELFR